MGHELTSLSDGWSRLLGLAGYDFVCEVDREGRYRRLCQAPRGCMGHEPGHLLGRSPFELGLVHPEDAACLETALRPLFEADEPVRCVCRFRQGDGGFRWMETTASAFLDPDGAWRGLFISRDLSEQARIQEELRRESRTLADVIDHIPLSIQLLDREGRTLRVNEAYARLFGSAPPQGESIWRDPRFRGPQLEALMASAREGGTISFPEFRLDAHAACPEPREPQVWVRMAAFPILDEQGRPDRYVFMHEDVTARREAGQALKEGERRLAEIIDYLPDPTLAVDAGRRVTVWNKAIVKLTGVPAADMIGRGDHAYTVPFFGRPCPQLMDLLWDESPELASRYSILQREQDTIFAEAFAPEPMNGRGIHMWLKATALRDEGGRIVGAVETIRDITDFKKAEQALRESEDRFRGLYLNTPDAIFWIAVEQDGTFRFEGANPAHESLTGAPSEEFRGKRIQDCFEPDLAEAIAADCARCVKTEAPVHFERALHVSGARKETETLLVPIRDPKGRIYRLVGTTRDVTQARHAEEALRQAQKLESLGVLAGGIAHDFNNLLTAILGNLNLAQAKVSGESPALPNLEAAERIVMKASDLTRQMLAYSGKGRFVVRLHDLNEVVKEMTRLLQVSISKKISLRLCLAERMAPIEADSAQIQQVIMNLVTNASDAIGEKEGLIRIATGMEDLDAAYIARTFANQTLKPGRFATVEVSDTGCGITPDLMERIFDPFFTTKTSGRGLGLSAMLGILRSHGAGYKIYSEVGRGTTFKILFPVAESGQQQAELPSEEEPNLLLAGTVLLVDDEPNILEAARAALELFGLRVNTAKDGREAMEIFRQAPGAIDLVLMDLTMPRMDGRETFQAMRQIRPDVRVILSSGYSEQDSLQEFIGKGLAGFIQKPYNLRELRKILEKFIRA